MLPILTADDYAMTDGISRSIEALAHVRRLSATSVMTTMPDWPEAASRLRDYRDRVAVGLHLNLTLGAPSGQMPRLCPDGVFPAKGALIRSALLGHLSPDEIKDEIERQLDAFEQHFGFAPDHVDGHQHVQVLPVVRKSLLDEIGARYGARPPLLRDPSNTWQELAAQGRQGAKAITVAALSAGFGRAARARGIHANRGFAGFSGFDMSVPYARELESALTQANATAKGVAIIMCHPGYADATLAALDTVVERRQQEHDALMRSEGLPERIWHVRRSADGASIDWRQEAA